MGLRIKSEGVAIFEI